MLSMVPNIVFVPNIRRTQNTDTGRKTQTQFITGLDHKEIYIKFYGAGRTICPIENGKPLLKLKHIPSILLMNS